jgi:hypothetical protein
VREPNEVAVEAYPDAVVVPLQSGFDPAPIPDPARASRSYFACRSGKRSVTASLAAQAAGSAIRQASRRRDSRLEGCRPADQGRLMGCLIFEKSSMNKIFAELPVTVFEAMSQLARDTTPSISARAFPIDPGPDDIRQAQAADAVAERLQSVSVDDGHPGAAQAIATHYQHWHKLSTSIR